MLQNLIRNFGLDEKFEPASFFGRFYQKYKSPKRYKLFGKARSRILKELDLVKYIESKRQLLSTSVGLLTPRQKLITSEFSQVLVYESSQYDYSNSTDDGQGEVLDIFKENALKRMIKSKNEIDRRLIDMIRVNQASR